MKEQKIYKFSDERRSMDFAELLKKRKTYKRFKDKDIALNNLAKILASLSHTPSLGNVQNVRIIVIKEENKKLALSKHAYEPSAVRSANTILLLYSDNEEITQIFGTKGREVYSYISCGQALQNILLQAEELGLASCPVPPSDSDAIKSLLDLKGDKMPVMLIALGYPEEEAVGIESSTYLPENFVAFENYKGERSKSLWPLHQTIQKVIHRIKKKKH